MKRLAPINLRVDRMYAAMDAASTLPAVPIETIINEFSRYLVIGTHDCAISVNRSWKLARVGFLTNSLGGNRKSSLNGLNALLIANTIGSAVKEAARSRSTNT